ncbi:unnamed protein product [Acanthoscelides obtectus]|uniref:Uncharacterized protein n=1 Tax=Acanthoscelides obtectus TaxID=200917 RepID=A0A9P0Q0T4_ACAOB|nr:unnamed protein product [Acanthoscelides obtectus]CAK1655880.1 hypothetical protein AOBTE_LOCUS19411 [Acanthoscelides obtectus]
MAKNTKSEEAYTVMKELSSNVKKRDDFDVYGEYVATTLRNLKSKSVQIYAKFEINNILYKAECSDIQPGTSTTPFATPTPSASPATSDQTGTKSYNTPEASSIPSTTPTPVTFPS